MAGRTVVLVTARRAPARTTGVLRLDRGRLVPAPGRAAGAAPSSAPAEPR